MTDVGEDPDSQAWFRFELANKFDKFKKWREKNGIPAQVDEKDLYLQ